MVKTTFEIKDDVYRRLVEASLRKYGNARSISKMANEVIDEHLKEKHIDDIEKHKSENERTKKLDIVERTFGAWGSGPTGSEHVRKLRKESEKRFKRLKRYGL